VNAGHPGHRHHLEMVPFAGDVAVAAVRKVDQTPVAIYSPMMGQDLQPQVLAMRPLETVEVPRVEADPYYPRRYCLHPPNSSSS
jgi:N-formylglutamate amidohydrolase